MATRQEAQEYLIDLILNYIIANAVDINGAGIDLTNYRRYIDPTTGQITIGNISNDSNLVLYEKDFRESFSPDLLNTIDDILDNCVTEPSPGEYDLADIVSDAWQLIPGGTSCDGFTDGTYNFFGGISFSGPLGESSDNPDTYSGTACNIPYGQMIGCDKLITDPIIDLLLTDDVLASLSQFIPIIEQQTDIDEGLAGDVLDTSIYELLPGGLTVQEQISKFFADYIRLRGDKPNDIQPYDEYQGFIDEDGDGTFDGWASSTDETTYTDIHDVSDDGLTGNITRLDGDAPTGFDTQTLQWLRDDLNTFLYDIDYDPVTNPIDTRPEYENQSGGYLKFRGLNQAVIIRSTEGNDIGLIGSDPGNPVWATQGFTITMWVRFLDKVSTGTLFNFGNPLRTNETPYGFKLETFIDDSDTENRYLRLVARDVDGYLRDSHVGNGSANSRINTTTSGLPTDSSVYTKIPIDFSEWFFIVASYNPDVNEDGSTFSNSNQDYWRNNVDASGGYVVSSGLGAKCKVEVISKSDLLRARGFQG